MQTLARDQREGAARRPLREELPCAACGRAPHPCHTFSGSGSVRRLWGRYAEVTVRLQDAFRVAFNAEGRAVRYPVEPLVGVQNHGAVLAC